MFLRVRDGFYKGEIREFPYLVGKSLLESGRAENPFAEPVLAPKAQAAEPACAAHPALEDPPTARQRQQRRRRER